MASGKKIMTKSNPMRPSLWMRKNWSLKLKNCWDGRLRYESTTVKLAGIKTSLPGIWKTHHTTTERVSCINSTRNTGIMGWTLRNTMCKEALLRSTRPRLSASLFCGNTAENIESKIKLDIMDNLHLCPDWSRLLLKIERGQPSPSLAHDK